jgi:hypothetical protein
LDFFIIGLVILGDREAESQQSQRQGSNPLHVYSPERGTESRLTAPAQPDGANADIIEGEMALMSRERVVGN